jgi:hypothetical protein
MALLCQFNVDCGRLISLCHITQLCHTDRLPARQRHIRDRLQLSFATACMLPGHQKEEEESYIHSEGLAIIVSNCVQ